MNTRWCADRLDATNHAKILMADMAQYMEVNNGSVAIKMGRFEFCADALLGLIEHHYSIDDETLLEELEASLRESFKTDNKLSNPQKLLREFDSRCGKLLSSQSDFIFISSIGIRNVTPSPCVIKGCSIQFHAALPEKFKEARQRLLKISNPIKVNAENENYIFVEVQVKAVNDASAFAMATEALAIYRSLLQLRFEKTISMFSGPNGNHTYPADAIAKMGNIHTIHRTDGSAVREAHWAEDTPNLAPPAKFKDFDSAQVKLNHMLEKMSQSPIEYQEFCRKTLVNYSNALDTTDPQAKFVKLWLCLELLTNSDTAEHIIKRTAFFYADGGIAKAELRSLRAYRNSHVHGGKQLPRMGMKNWTLCTFIETILHFVISNHFQFSKPSQWHEFMSSTTDIASIDEQISRLELVKKFTTPSPEEEE